MYDTVKAYLVLDSPLDLALFEGHRVVSDARGEWSRYWLNVGSLRVNYFPASLRISVEFSVVRMSGCDWLANPSEADKERVLDAVNRLLSERLRLAADVRGWTVQRVDYAWNFAVDNVALALAALSSVRIGGMSRHEYADDVGIVWKSKHKDGRWLKFYDKGKQLGLGAVSVLRFEVSNLKRSVRYMCERWFGCERVVREVLRPGRALYVLALMYQRLGLADLDVSSGELMVRLRGAFGRSASAAYYARECILSYGTRAYTELGLMSSNSYYRWRRRLGSSGFLVGGDVGVQGLGLPVAEVIHQIRANNLGSDGAAAPYINKKNFRAAFGLHWDQAPGVNLLERAYETAT